MVIISVNHLDVRPGYHTSPLATLKGLHKQNVTCKQEFLSRQNTVTEHEFTFNLDLFKLPSEKRSHQSSLTLRLRCTHIDIC